MGGAGGGWRINLCLFSRGPFQLAAGLSLSLKTTAEPELNDSQFHNKFCLQPFFSHQVCQITTGTSCPCFIPSLGLEMKMEIHQLIQLFSFFFPHRLTDTKGLQSLHQWNHLNHHKSFMLTDQHFYCKFAFLKPLSDYHILDNLCQFLKLFLV